MVADRSLPDDGTRLVGSVLGAELFVHTLATGETRWLNRPEIDGHIMGAFSPNGTHIATLAIIDPGEGLEENNELIAVETIDVATGAARTVWQGRGSWAECALAWSPDGRLLVASYQGYDDILNTTIVLDVATGRTIATLQDRIPLNNPHAVWISDNEFATFPEVDDGIAILRADRAREHVEERIKQGDNGEFFGACNGRYVRRPRYSKDPDITMLYTTTLDGHDPKMLLPISSWISISSVDGR